MKTRTRAQGMGLWWVLVQVALKYPETLCLVSMCATVMLDIHPIATRNLCPFMHIVPHKVCIAYSISFKGGNLMR